MQRILGTQNGEVTDQVLVFAERQAGDDPQFARSGIQVGEPHPLRDRVGIVEFRIGLTAPEGQLVVESRRDLLDPGGGRSCCGRAAEVDDFGQRGARRGHRPL
ncbi:Uncharacterised protein [Mycobacteroides abscessus subsp. abscessus]|nr:Uncharacterised protein [Mycobacteroides abscessus subsp. abscessus]